MTALSALTTMQVGGEPANLLRCDSRSDIIETALRVWTRGDDWLVLGGGSNIVAADDLSELTVIQIASKGIETRIESGRAIIRVQAGEIWDDFVAHCIAAGLSGIEALSGIPGLVGAAPIQNIGAYGQEVANSILRVEFLDYETHELEIIENVDLGFGYRDSIFKRGKLGVITWVEFQLFETGGLSAPIQFDQLASSLGAALGSQLPLTQVRDQVLALRASKGMVFSKEDLDSHGCGSFFTNPIVSDTFARTLPQDAPKFETIEDDGLTVKLSAAWLIEHAGIKKGYSLPGSKVSVSSKHTLAITNRGGATAFEVVQLAGFIQQRVLNTFGVNLVPEAQLIGF